MNVASIRDSAAAGRACARVGTREKIRRPRSFGTKRTNGVWTVAGRFAARCYISTWRKAGMDRRLIGRDAVILMTRVDMFCDIFSARENDACAPKYL